MRTRSGSPSGIRPTASGGFASVGGVRPHDPPLVRADADRALALDDLDVEAPLAAVGALAFGLAGAGSRAGVAVIIGSRDEGRAREAAEKAGASQGLHNADAARAARVVFLTVPFRNQSENLTNLRDVLQEGQLLVDCT